MKLRISLLAFALAAAALGGACTINDYCIGCPNGDDSGGDDAGHDGGVIDGNDGSVPPDACVPVGVEVCNGLDDDCNGTPDDNIAQVGDSCGMNVGQCTVGVFECNAGVLECSGTPGSPEACDNIDNDCNGVVDNGNPEGGALCGSNVGECTAGVTTCTPGGVLQCVGSMGTPGQDPEICDGKDNDCDGSFDEDVPTAGDCGFPTTGECDPGTLTCVGGSFLCVGGQGPTFEECDNLDQDCDGNNTNGWDLQGDVRNCGSCGNNCLNTIQNASEQCVGGQCAIATCDPGFFNDPTMPPNPTSPNCLYACDYQGQFEACNGVDDDCDHAVDEAADLSPPPICSSVGACNGTQATCEVSPGPPPVSAFDCVYGPDVSVDANGDIQPENTCDHIDNDCDGQTDESYPLVGTPCSDAGVGECQGHGLYDCDPNDSLAAPICVIDDPGATNPPPNETACDDRDEDCDGLTDENPSTLQQWVDIGGGRSIMKYEASHPDARAGVVGTKTAYVCSSANVQPWVMIKQPDAEVACASIGARLCSEQEWHRACSVVAGTTWPFTEPAAASGYMFFEAEDYYQKAARTSGGTARTWVPDYTSGYSGISALRASPNTGADVLIPNALAQSPRLDFRVNFTTTGNHFVWVHMYRNAGADDSVHLGINPVRDISTMTRAANVVTVTTTAAHGFPVGGTVTITGALDSAFDGTYAIVAAPTATTFTFAQVAANAATTGGTAFTMVVRNNNTLVRGGGTATVTTSVAHGFVAGSTVIIAGALNNAFNGTFQIVATPTATTFTYALAGGAANTTMGTSTVGGAVRTVSNGSSLAWEWRVSAVIGVPATGDRLVSVWMERDGVKVDAIVVQQINSTTPVETRGPGGTWSFQNNPTVFVNNTCNGFENGAATVLDGGTKGQCFAAQTTGVFDMSGNVKEWTLERLPGENPIRGGAFNNIQGGTTCGNAFSLANDAFFFNNVGFRCCK